MDVDLMVWIVLPLVGGIVSAIYAARRDTIRAEELETRVRQLELIEAGRTEPPPKEEWINLIGQVTQNTQAIECLDEILNTEDE